MKGELRRVLRLRDLIFYGIVVIQPTAPMPLFGVASQEARGHVVTAVLIAMIGMALTAVSYGRMARVYPSAGSAYSYINGEFGATAGFVAGWSILLDYILNPIICVIWCSGAAMNFYSGIPIWGWEIFFAILFTLLNLRGIETSARINTWMAISMGVVVVYALAMMARYIFGEGGHDLAFYTRPFYDPATFNLRAVSAGTALAALTYIGFDNISTLSEETIDPEKNILRATVLVCLLTGVIAAIEVYAGQLVWPDFSKYPNVDTAYVYVAGRAGGQVLFHLMNVTLLVASVGSGMGAQIGAARVMYGMARDKALPGAFAYVHPTTGVPSRNVLVCGVAALIGAFLMSYQLGAEMLNFGAFLAFSGVNLACIRYEYGKALPDSRASENSARPHGLASMTAPRFWMPLLGLLICLYIWISLRWQAKLAGTIWVLLGLLYFFLRGTRHDQHHPHQD
jgi:putrescine importer